MVARLEHLEARYRFGLRVVADKARSVFLSLFLVCLTASFVAGSHIHLDPSIVQKTEISAKPAPAPTGLGAQFASRHKPHEQGKTASEDSGEAPLKVPAKHSTTHVHDVPFVTLSNVVATACGYQTICKLSPQRSQVFELSTDIFHPPKLG